MVNKGASCSNSCEGINFEFGLASKEAKQVRRIAVSSVRSTALSLQFTLGLVSPLWVSEDSENNLFRSTLNLWILSKSTFGSVDSIPCFLPTSPKSLKLPSAK